MGKHDIQHRRNCPWGTQQSHNMQKPSPERRIMMLPPTTFYRHDDGAHQKGLFELLQGTEQRWPPPESRTSTSIPCHIITRAPRHPPRHNFVPGMGTALMRSWRRSPADIRSTLPAPTAEGYTKELCIPHNCPPYQCWWVCSSLNHTVMTLHMAEQEEPTWPGLD